MVLADLYYFNHRHKTVSAYKLNTMVRISECNALIVDVINFVKILFISFSFNSNSTESIRKLHQTFISKSAIPNFI